MRKLINLLHLISWDSTHINTWKNNGDQKNTGKTNTKTAISRQHKTGNVYRKIIYWKSRNIYTWYTCFKNS